MLKTVRITLADFARLSMVRKAGFLLLLFAAIVSVGQGVRNAQRFSQDFQWSPTVLFVEGTNPYVDFLSGNPNGRIILNQEPNYAHGLYVALAPLAALDWSQAKIVWALFNLVASLLIAVWIGRRAGLEGMMLAVLVLAFLCSTPFRNNLSNGQHAVLVLLAACALLLANSLRGALLTGFAYLKYSFAPPLAAFLFFKNGPKHLLLSLVPGIVGYAIFLAYVGGDPLAVLVQPLKVNATTLLVGEGDWMSLTTLLYPHKQGVLYALIFYGAPLALSTVIAFFAAKRVADPLLAFSIVCVTALLCFRHLRYDFVFLLPALAYALKRAEQFPARIALAAIAFQWYAARSFDPSAVFEFENSKLILIYVNFLLCVLVLVCLFMMSKKSAMISTEPATTTESIPELRA
jgi:hypothetical protein